MSRLDRITGRRSLTGNSRSKALNITKRSWELNTQVITVTTKDKKKLKLKTSVKTIRSLKKQKLII